MLLKITIINAFQVDVAVDRVPTLLPKANGLENLTRLQANTQSTGIIEEAKSLI